MKASQVKTRDHRWPCSVLFPLVLAAAGPAAAEPAALTGEAIKNLIPGRTLNINTPLGMPLPVSFESDGTMSASAGGRLKYFLGSKRDTGTWWVRSGKLCQRWKVWLGRDEHCILVIQNGQNFRWRSDDGQSGTANLVPLASPRRPGQPPYALGGPDRQVHPQNAAGEPQHVPIPARADSQNNMKSTSEKASVGPISVTAQETKDKNLALLVPSETTRGAETDRQFFAAAFHSQGQQDLIRISIGEYLKSQSENRWCQYDEAFNNAGITWPSLFVEAKRSIHHYAEVPSASCLSVQPPLQAISSPLLFEVR